MAAPPAGLLQGRRRALRRAALPAVALTSTFSPLPAVSGAPPLLAGMLGALGLLTGAPALALDAPVGRVVLSLSGAVNHRNAEHGATFDLAMLDALPQHRITTSTPWYPQPRVFAGPLLRHVLMAAGAQGRPLRAVALNDYRADVPWIDAQQHELLLATSLDDVRLTVREKGPLLLVYPFDQNAALRSAVYYSRSVWQLKAIEVQ